MTVKLFIALLFAIFLHESSHAIQYFTVTEEQEPGTFVGNITRRENVKYYFSGQVDYFTINPNYGSIFTKTKIDRETLTTDELKYVVVTSTPVSATEVSIRVLDINDNRPTFKKASLSLKISEAVDVGALIPIERATDPDLGQNSVTNYSIISGNDDHKFGIEIILNLLHLKVKKRLDRESVSSYHLNISAADNGSPRKYGYVSLNITVLDVNDNAPLFNPTTYRADIFENATIGTILLQIKATDQDAGKNGQISYFLKDASFFTINQETGAISLKSRLDHEKSPSVVLNVDVFDGGNPPLVAKATVTVTVKDVNDNNPTIQTNGVTRKQLSENKLESHLFFITVSDDDFGPVSVVIVSGNEKNSFSLKNFGKKHYFLSTTFPLDREEKANYSLLLRASDSGIPQLKTDYNLFIEVLDENDNKPVFEKRVYSATVIEGCPKGSYVADVKATDLDAGFNAIINYFITSTVYNNWFQINRRTGLITTSVDGIDYDLLNSTSINLTVTASDLGNPSLNSSVTVDITVQNVNDNSPRFRQLAYVASVSESLPVNSLIISVIADDSDKGTDGNIYYGFHYSPPIVLNTFRLDRVTGEIFLAKKLDYSDIRLFEFYIIATDYGKPSRNSKTQVKVHVTDTDNHAPVFSTKEFYINVIASRSHGIIRKFNALDLDSGAFGHVTYSIESPSCCNYFTINRLTGVLNSTRLLDSGSTYNLITSATCNGKTSRASISIVVVDDLLKNPSFSRSEYLFQVEENVSGKLVGRLVLMEMVQNALYAIEAGNELGFFRVNEEGKLFTEKGIDREKHSSFVLQVAVKTNETLFLTARATVTVLIKDVNDNRPTLIKQQIQDFQLREDAFIGYHVFTVSATDADYGQNGIVRYYLQRDSANVPFQIDPSTGSVFLSKSLMSTSQSQYSIVVEIADSGSPRQSLTAAFLINVIDINDHFPKFSSPFSNVVIQRNLSVNSQFFKVVAEDADYGSNSKLLFKIQSGNTGDTFGIFPSGWIYLKSLSLRADLDYYALDIIAYDLGRPSNSNTTEVKIFVEQTGSMKVFKSPRLTVSVKENQSPGTFVIDVSRNALAGRSNVSYKLYKKSKYIRLDSASGIVRTRTSLDREAIVSTGNDTVVSIVIAEQTVGNVIVKESCILIIDVADENDNAPAFEKTAYSAFVNETSPAGTPVLLIHAVDKDDPTTSTIFYAMRPAQTHFAIDASTGVIYVASPGPLLDYDQKKTYNFSVSATDSKNSSLFTSCFVLVHVRDENNNKPIFTNQVAVFSLSEATPVGSTLFKLTAADKDTGMSGFVTYSLSSLDSQDAFKINEYSGEIFLAKAVDYETRSSSHIINITAMDHGSPSLQESMSVRISVVDYNDNAPHFDDFPATVYVTENTVSSTVIGRCTATDRDSGPNKKIRYSVIEQSPVANRFKVDANNCKISTTGVLDREQVDSYYIVIKAEDSAENHSKRLSSTKNITIIVEDVNDNVPVFLPPFAAGFARTSATGWEIIKIIATDADNGKNGTVRYSLRSKLDSTCFAVNAQTGSVTVVAPLSSSKKIFEVEIRATDQGSKEQRHSTALFRFFVTGTPSNALVCSGTGRASIYENVGIGTNVYKVSVVSPEAASQVLYFLKNGNEGTSFDVNSTTGWIFTTRSIDFDSGKHRYNLVVYAVEKAGSSPRSAECSVLIDIKDVNDNAPVFPSSINHVSVPENARIGHVVYEYRAKDLDSNDNGLVEYAIASGNLLSKFSVEADTGKVVLAKLLDREKTASYTLNVEASNKGSQKSFSKLIVKVADVNDNAPVFNQTFYSFTVPENSPKYSYVGTVKAADRDVGRNGEIDYEILDKDQNAFAIDRTTGVIRVTGILDYEAIPNFLVDVRAIDFGDVRLSSVVTVFVNLNDVNDNCPVFSSGLNYVSQVQENLPAGVFVFKVAAIDKDSGDNGKVFYEIVDGNAKNSFAVLAKGEVHTKRPLDREDQAKFKLIIRAKDKAALSGRNCLSYATLTVDVLDSNDNTPILNQPHEIHISESSKLGVTLYTLTATDKDNGANSTVRFSLIEPNEVSDLFHLAVNGSLSLLSRLDYEVRKVYHVNVSISDLGSPAQRSVSKLTIAVTDANDNNPIISPHPSSISVLENATLGTTLMEFSAADLDFGANSQIGFSILSGNKNGTFSIEAASGILYLEKSMNRENTAFYLLEIEAKDGGIPQRRGITSLRINVADVNDCVPTFSAPAYNVSVLENSPVGEIFTLKASDCDAASNGVVKYSLEKSPSSDHFTIGPTTGTITLVGKLDREITKLVSLKVTARDSGLPPLSRTATVFVNVQDVNDNAPVISPSNATKYLKENLNGNIEVQKFEITDSDDGLNATLDVGLVNGLASFQLKKVGALFVLSTTRGLDRESKDYYKLQIEASDRGSPKKTTLAYLHLFVEDDNDSPPVFGMRRYEIKTQAMAPIGSFVVQLTVTDKDTLANSNVQFVIVSGNTSYVDIEKETGVILTKMLMPLNTVFEIKVEASDPSKPNLKDITTVAVETTTGFPLFSHGNLYDDLSESSPVGTIVMKVNATSQVEGPPGVIHYYISTGNGNGAFRIEENNGKIRINRHLDYESLQVYSLWIEARDSKNPPQSAYVKLVIAVRNENDTAPIITDPKGAVLFTENRGSNALVTRVVAVDVDNPLSTRRLRYGLGPSAASLPFFIDPVSGEVRSTKLLDREEADRYLLEVVVYPEGQYSLSSVYNLSIVIQDVNDNKPVVHSPHQVEIPESLSVGGLVAVLNVTDNDSGANGAMTFYLISDTFKIDKNKGRITLSKSLDREVQQKYTLSIQVKDPSYQNTHMLTVIVLDVNDSPPYFPSDQVYVNVSESTLVGKIFGQVRAMDKDLGSNAACFYHIEPRSGYGFVRINDLTGSLSLKRSMRFTKGFASNNTRRLTLKARNLYPPFYLARTKLIIRVLDANDHQPVFSSIVYQAYVESIAAIGYLVTIVSASDDYDVGQNANIMYSVISGNGSNIFMLDGGRIKVKAGLQSFVNSVLQLTIEARDEGVPMQTSKATVNIKVTEENRYSPVFSKGSFGVTVSENRQLYKELIKVVAVDQDSGVNGQLTFSIKSGNFDGIFAIGKKNGSVYLVKSLDYEKTSSHTLVVEAADNGQVHKRSSTVNVEVKVTDVNDNKPVFTSMEYDATVLENARPNTQVTKVVATDADSAPFNVISYDIIDPKGRVFFTINPSTGMIRTRTGINYETNSAFTIKVAASDSGFSGLSSRVDVRVNVIGVNEYQPRFPIQSYNFTVSRHAVVNAFVGAVSAIDNDKGIDGVSVYLPRFPIDKCPFSLDTANGNIRVRRKLKVGKYVLPIFVKNVVKRDLTPTDVDQANVNIDVIEGNEPPNFAVASFSANIDENAPTGRFVTTVTARDNDASPSEVIRYEIVKQLPRQAFAIGERTGAVTVSGLLDREASPKYHLIVRASDSGSPPASNTTTLVITLVDTNDNAPKVEKCDGNVFENATVGTRITSILITDEDADPNRGPFTYRVTAGDIDVSSAGEFRVAAPLDREKRAEYNLTLTVTDNGSPAQQTTAFCVIVVKDVSDVMPKKRNVLVIVNNLGSFPPGGLVGDLSPNDADVSDVYTCTAESVHSVFHFEPSSCRLHVASHRNIGYKMVNFTAVSHDARVNDTAFIHFVPITNVTVNNTLFFRLQGFARTVLDFTNNSIVKLNNFLGSISPASSIIRVIGYKQQTPETLDLIAAMLDKGSSNAMPVKAAETLISSNSARIQSITGASHLELPHQACSSQHLCRNNGTCYEIKSLDSHTVLWNSEKLIFVSVSFKATYACRCKPGFHGSHCEKIVSNCFPNPCQNGGVCNERSTHRVPTSSCSCNAGYTGRYCQDDVDECASSPCQNGGNCVNTYGSYHCRCVSKYTGRNCESAIDFCNPNPCLFSGLCVSNDVSFTCNCKFGNLGRYCEINPITFSALSYLTFNSFRNKALNVSIDFASYDKNSLLLYGFSRTLTGLQSPFVGFEVVNGRVRFSYNFGLAVRRYSIESLHVADGNWHTASFYLSGKKLLLKVDSISNERVVNEANQSPDLQGDPLYIAGVPSVDVILRRPKQVSVDDFTGCMRNIYVNGYHVDKSTALSSHLVNGGCAKAAGCSSSTCKNGQCVDDWKGFQCQCKTGFSGNTCTAVAKPFTFSGTSFVMFKLKESYRRKLLLAKDSNPGRRRKSTANTLPETNSFSVEFRTRNANGILLFAEDIGGNFTVLHIENGEVHYKFDLGGKGSGTMAIRRPLITDGKWHNLTLLVSEKTVSLSLDSNQAQNSFSVSPHRFYSVKTDSLSIAGTQNPRSIDGKQLLNFHGCLSKISLNNDNLAIQSSDKFNVTTVGPSSNNCDGSDVCASNPCSDPVKSYCINEWEAYRCVDPGKCSSNPCKNRATCLPSGSSYSCKCVGNFTGMNCGTPLICLQNPCAVGEACVANEKTIYSCMPMAVEKRKPLSSGEVAMIVVFTMVGLGLAVVIVFIWRKPQRNKAKTFQGDFAADGRGIEMKHQSKQSELEGDDFERELQSEAVNARQGPLPSMKSYDNDAYQSEIPDEMLHMISRRHVSTSQPAIKEPRSHRTNKRVSNANRSLPILSYKGEQHAEQHRNNRILRDLRGSSLQSQLDNMDVEIDRRSNERIKELMDTSKLGTATPPFESGFESTGSDIDSDRDQASVTDMIDGSSQLEMYDLEVASIGFSEMSWQNDNNSSSSRDIRRDFVDKRLDRLRHLVPQFSSYDYGAAISDRNTRSDRLSDRLSDLVEQDSSSDSDGSFTGSEYEYGDERISTNKLSRKHLVFSRHPQASDSEAESSIMPRRSSVESSLTNMTDFGSVQPMPESKENTSSSTPTIDWDQLLNWALKYENLSNVYKDLAALSLDAQRPPRISSARASERRKRDQEAAHKPIKFLSAQELHQTEEYV